MIGSKVIAMQLEIEHTDLFCKGDELALRESATDGATPSIF